ncbi:CoA transferase [Bacillus sp. AGMB 02131]|uniref:CoA transferase n=1 Tax=Peribacillus faecalis TaxID=2772559 RepID=A0A927CXW8_9BACI|nr:CoA transferase [Peribacillus faecalis]MBD3107339.1 CoA transferase [Peribacillus faecalis]
MKTTKETLLHDLKILEIVNGPSGSYAGRLLSKSGASVTRISRPEEHRSVFRNAGKRIVCFSNDEELLEYVTECLALRWDLIIWDSHCTLKCKDLLNSFFENQRSSETCIGVYLDFPNGIGTEEEYALQAMGGWMELTGNPELKPLQVGGYPASYLVGAHAAAGGLLAHLTLRPNKKHLVQINALTVVVSALEGAFSTYLATGEERSRMGNRHHAIAPMAIMPCTDGMIFLGAPVNEKWELLESWAELPHKPEWNNDVSRLKHCASLEAELSEWTRSMKKSELFYTGQAFRMPFAYVQSLQEVKDCLHLKEREFWERGNHISLPWAIKTNCTGKGFIKDKDTIRILDMTNMWSGPYCTRLFADLGIEVIKIEAPHRPDGIRSQKGATAPFYRELNRNKRGISLDLNVMEDRQKFLELVEISDVIVENFSPRVMPNFGLQYEQLWKYQPQLINLSLSAFGQTGPYRDFVGYGPTLEAMSGIAALTHYDDGKPWLPGFSVSDIGAGIHGAFVLAASLICRQRNGEGIRIDLSQYEVACQLVGDCFFEGCADSQTEAEGQIRNLKSIADDSGVHKLSITGETSLIGTPWQSKEWKVSANPAPELGQHTEELFNSL